MFGFLKDDRKKAEIGDVRSQLLQVDRDVYDFFAQLGDDVGNIHWGDFYNTNTKEFEALAIREIKGSKAVRFSTLFSDDTIDDRASLTQYVLREHPFELNVFTAIDKNNQQASYLERRRITAVVLDHIASTNRFGKVVESMGVGAARSDPVNVKNHLLYQTTFTFSVVESLPRY